MVKIWMLIILSIALIILSNSSAGANENDFRVRLTVGLVNWNPALIFFVSPASPDSLLSSETEITMTNTCGLSFNPSSGDVQVVSQNCFKVRFDQDNHVAQFWATAEDLKPYLKKVFSLTIKNGPEELVYSNKVEYTLTGIPSKGRILATWGRVKTQAERD